MLYVLLRVALVACWPSMRVSMVTVTVGGVVAWMAQVTCKCVLHTSMGGMGSILAQLKHQCGWNGWHARVDHVLQRVAWVASWHR